MKRRRKPLAQATKEKIRRALKNKRRARTSSNLSRQFKALGSAMVGAGVKGAATGAIYSVVSNEVNKKPNKFENVGRNALIGGIAGAASVPVITTIDGIAVSASRRKYRR